MKKLILSGSVVKGLTLRSILYAPAIWIDVIGDWYCACCQHAGKDYYRPLCEYLFLFHHWLTIITKCIYRSTKDVLYRTSLGLRK